MKTLTWVVTWISKRRVDPVLLVAAAVEIPRWTFAFMAIHEPIWAGVALGTLLSWAAKRGWDAFFASGSKWMLGLNLFSLFTAVAVISPVLYAMTYGPVTQVHLPDTLAALGPAALGVWAVLLALTTFIPLVQVACATYYSKMNAVEPELDDSFDAAINALAGAPVGWQQNIRSDTTIYDEASGLIVNPSSNGQAAPATNRWNTQDVPPTNGDNMRLLWQSYRAAGKSIGQADEAVAADVGVNPRTVANKRRAQNWE